MYDLPDADAAWTRLAHLAPGRRHPRGARVWRRGARAWTLCIVVGVYMLDRRVRVVTRDEHTQRLHARPATLAELRPCKQFVTTTRRSY